MGESETWWVARCPTCKSARACVVDDNAQDIADLVRGGYTVEKEPAPVTFSPHTCGKKRRRRSVPRNYGAGDA